MARALRIEYPGAFYHVMSRGNERKPVFLNTSDRLRFISYLKSAHLRYAAVIHAYCLMNNHYHILLETPEGNLSQIMHHINGAYTTAFNVIHKRAGHLFQGRYKSILVDADAYSAELSRYIHLNPVRAGISSTPEGYKWSSYNYYTGRMNKPDWLTVDLILGYVDQHIQVAQSKYAAFVSARLHGEYESPLKRAFASTILGGEDFVERIADNYLGSKKTDRATPDVKKRGRADDVSTIHRKVRALMHGNPQLVKKTTILLCHRYGASRLKEIGDYFGISESAVSLSSCRFSETLKGNRKLRKDVERLKAKLNL